MAGMERFPRHLLALAHQEAQHFHQPQISTEHLLMGLMLEEDGVAGRVLRDLGVEPERMREVIEKLADNAPSMHEN
jgi:ATP-dependent Clp protease ATP-binding subunit ClpC